MVLVVFTGNAEGVGDALVAVATPVAVAVDQAGELRLLGHVIGIFRGVIVDAIGLHQVLSEQAPCAFLVLPHLALPGDHRQGAVRLVTEAEHGDRPFRQLDSFETVSGRHLGRGRTGNPQDEGKRDGSDRGKFHGFK